MRCFSFHNFVINTSLSVGLGATGSNTRVSENMGRPMVKPPIRNDVFRERSVSAKVTKNSGLECFVLARNCQEKQNKLYTAVFNTFFRSECRRYSEVSGWDTQGRTNIISMIR